MSRKYKLKNRVKRLETHFKASEYPNNFKKIKGLIYLVLLDTVFLYGSNHPSYLPILKDFHYWISLLKIWIAMFLIFF